MSWWQDDPREIYWCEITGRPDVGSDLKCPQRKADGTSYWSFDLIREVKPGDVVFHYSTKKVAFVAASTAGGPVESREIVGRGRGTTSRPKKGEPERPPEPQEGWFLPLVRTIEIDSHTFQFAGHNASSRWIEEWVEKRRADGFAPTIPFQLYGATKGETRVRGSQGYLTKMPRDFVQRFSWLRHSAADLLEPRVEPTHGARHSAPSAQAAAVFTPKADTGYLATVTGGVQARSRSHETLVNRVGELLLQAGADVVTAHPIDMLMRGPLSIIIEAKIVGTSARDAVREAVGQLYDYQHFYGPADAHLCILLDEEPDAKLQSYVEDVRGLLLCWLTAEGFDAGPRTSEVLAAAGLVE